MALVAFTRIICRDFRFTYGLCGIKHKLTRIPTALICSKENRDSDYKKPEPWPYKTRRFGFFQRYYESTVKRFEENTKIIVVDGNIASGKSSFAKHLAETFDMVYIPEPTMENYYINSYGIDIRKLDPILPPSFQSCDINTFYKNPHHRNVAMFQYRMFVNRFIQYIDALAHLLNTGQGIVMDRCVYGDIGFMKTMHKVGYISKPAHDYYVDAFNNSVDDLLRPHLIVYLDVTVDVALQRIKERNRPEEVNSKVLTKEYLESLEYEYKHSYLKNLENHTEILIYDWNQYGDVEVVVEDIEHIDFDRFTKYDDKLKDWRKIDDWEWAEARDLYTNKKQSLLCNVNIFRPEVSELYHPGEECVEYDEIMSKVPGEKYLEGFNPDLGDSVLFKVWKDYTRTLYDRRYTQQR